MESQRIKENVTTRACLLPFIDSFQKHFVNGSMAKSPISVPVHSDYSSCVQNTENHIAAYEDRPDCRDCGESARNGESTRKRYEL